MQDIRAKLAKKLQPDDTVERCGFVTARGRIVEVTNVAEDPALQFHIHPKEVIKWRAKGAVATWHTHPISDPNLSGEDYNCFISWDDMVHYVIGRREGQPTVITYSVEDGMVVQKS